MKIDKPLFYEIKAAQKDGADSITIGKDFKINLQTINKVLVCEDWSEFSGTDANVLTEKVSPMQKGYYKSLVSRYNNERESAKENMEATYEQLYTLREQLKSSWAMIKLLEQRKQYLQKEIIMMEEYMKNGGDVIEEHLEK